MPKNLTLYECNQSTSSWHVQFTTHPVFGFTRSLRSPGLGPYLCGFSRSVFQSLGSAGQSDGLCVHQVWVHPVCGFTNSVFMWQAFFAENESWQRRHCACCSVMISPPCLPQQRLANLLNDHKLYNWIHILASVFTGGAVLFALALVSPSCSLQTLESNYEQLENLSIFPYVLNCIHHKNDRTVALHSSFKANLLSDFNLADEGRTFITLYCEKFCAPRTNQSGNVPVLLDFCTFHTSSCKLLSVCTSLLLQRDNADNRRPIAFDKRRSILLWVSWNLPDDVHRFSRRFQFCSCVTEHPSDVERRYRLGSSRERLDTVPA